MKVMISNMQDKISLTVSLENKLQAMADYLLQSEGCAGDLETNIVLVEDNFMKDLNEKYRSREGTTDVLSFNLQEGLPGDAGEGDDVLGDVYISVEKALKQAQEANISIEEEILFLASHGVLHLLGYTHENPQNEEMMEIKQEKALSFIKKDSGNG